MSAAMSQEGVYSILHFFVKFSCPVRTSRSTAMEILCCWVLFGENVVANVQGMDQLTQEPVTTGHEFRLRG
eukprot:3713195-Lingulodinium_polyedra.AAC.1